MTFSRDDVYSFELTDRDTGLSYRIQKAEASSTSTSAANDTITLANHGLLLQETSSQQVLIVTLVLLRPIT